MEDLRSHIDQSLLKLLSGFEAQPAEGNWNKLSHFLEHVENPADLGLNTRLSDFESDPPEHLEKAILNNHLIQTHVIDFALRNTLDQLEASGNLDLDQVVDQKKKRRLLPFLLLGLLAFCGTYFIVHYKSNNELSSSKHRYDNTELNSNPIPELENTQGQLQKRSRKAVENKDQRRRNQVQKGSSVVSNNWDETNHSSNFTDIASMDISNEDVELQAMALKPFGGFYTRYEQEFVPKEKQETHMPSLIRSPFQIGLWSGYYFEKRNSMSSDAAYVPKDGEALMNQGNAALKTGRTIQLDIRFRIKRQIAVSAGLQYSSAQSNTQFNYIYSDIPVFDSTGRLKGYIYRSPQVSPHINQVVNSTSQSVFVPVDLNLQLWSSGAWQLSGGIGFNLQLLSQGRYTVLDYEKGKLQTHVYNQGLKLQPNVQINCLYAISPMLSLGFGYRMAYRAMPTADTEKYFKGREIGNSIQFGLVFHPLIKKK